MITVKMGTIGLEQSAIAQTLGKLFNIKFKSFDAIRKIVNLQKAIGEKNKEYTELLKKVMEAHGEENEEGGQYIKNDNPEFLELLDTDADLGMEKIQLSGKDFEGAELTSSEYIILETFQKSRPLHQLQSQRRYLVC